jgi:hypothetical protein
MIRNDVVMSFDFIADGWDVNVQKEWLYPFSSKQENNRHRFADFN